MIELACSYAVVRVVNGIVELFFKTILKIVHSDEKILNDSLNKPYVMGSL